MQETKKNEFVKEKILTIKKGPARFRNWSFFDYWDFSLLICFPFGFLRFLDLFLIDFEIKLDCQH
jgi:hypothetical protein